MAARELEGKGRGEESRLDIQEAELAEFVKDYMRELRGVVSMPTPHFLAFITGCRTLCFLRLETG